MAALEADNIITQIKGFGSLSILRQVGLLVGLAASIALGFSIVLWSKGAEYGVLYSNLEISDAVNIASELQKTGIKYRLSEDSGIVMVDKSRIHDARMLLAASGMPKGIGNGYEILEQDQGFGVSHFMENIRYQRALEGELARTISSINSVRSARVHLAIPKKSSFVRNRNKPTASVSIDLYPGRNIDSGQVSAISHLVAASIPDLDSDEVIVIDQKGRLLTESYGDSDVKLSSSQFEHMKKVEEYYVSRIESILIPLVGYDSVKAQVSAEIDYTVTEKTQETFNPDLPAIRSEQLVRENSTGRSQNGIPGSPSNQVNGDIIANDEITSGSGGTASSRTTRNYELDKTISHTRMGGSNVSRLSVAVVIDDEKIFDDSGEVERKPVSEEKLEHITKLVKEAIGYDAERGDSVNVVNSRFNEIRAEEIEQQSSLLDNPNIVNIAKYIGAGIIVLGLIFGVLKPILKDLAKLGEQTKSQNKIISPASSGERMQASYTEDGPRQVYENNLAQAKTIATQDPKRVAQVVNNWVTSDG